MRALVIAALLACAAAGWIAYVHVWRYGDAHPLVYRLAALSDFETAHPFSRVTTTATEERVLIASGPRSSTGYALEVRRAVVERARVSIVVRELDKPGRARVTYPYRLLVFPKLDKPVHVHWEGRS
jgi:predicted DNA-binding transcriptional regulator YafY